MKNYSDELGQQQTLLILKKYGLLIVLIVASVVGLLAGQQYWKNHTNQRLNDTSMEYETVIKELETDKTGSMPHVAEFIQNNTNTYGAMAALDYANYLVNKGDLAGAEQQLRQGLMQTKEDNLLSLLRLRLARVQIAQQKNEDALATLAQVQTVGWMAEAEYLRGNILLSQGKIEEAKLAYNKAFTLNPPKAIAERIKQQLDNLIA